MKKRYPRVLVVLNFILCAYLITVNGNRIYTNYKNKKAIKELHYGIKANELRKTLNIPIIDTFMKADYFNDKYLGNTWTADYEIPEIGKTLHIFKTVIPFDKNHGLQIERDAFRKHEQNGKIMQLNIDIEVIGDSTTRRKGELFEIPIKNIIELDEIGIDSIAKIWKINNW